MTEQAALLDDHNASALRCKTALYGMQLLDSERVCNITKVHKTASVWFERLLSMLALKYYMYRRKRGQRPLQQITTTDQLRFKLLMVVVRNVARPAASRTKTVLNYE